MKLQPGDYVSTKGMTEEQYHAIAKAFFAAGCEKEEYGIDDFDWNDAEYVGWERKSNGFAHWNRGCYFGTPNRLLTIDQILSIPPEWDGTGLPPVDSLVRYVKRTQCFDHYGEGKVLAIHGGWAWLSTEDGHALETIDIHDLSPIRSDREKAIKEIKSIIVRHGWLGADGTASKEIATALYDAGYRKQQEAKA